MREQRGSVEISVRVARDGTDLLAAGGPFGESSRLDRKALGVAHRLQRRFVEIAKMRDLVPRRPAVEGAAQTPLLRRQGGAQRVEIPVLVAQFERGLVVDVGGHLRVPAGAH